MAYVYPSDIRFRQSSISDHFRNGENLINVFTDLVNGDLEIDDIDDITCVLWNSEYWVIHGNRRLFLYQVYCFVFIFFQFFSSGTNLSNLL